LGTFSKIQLKHKLSNRQAFLFDLKIAKKHAS